jgi:uncharacterized membrane protein
MSLPTSETVPFPEDELPPARRRRQQRLVLPDREDDRARLLDELGLRLTPGLDFFLSALLSGFMFGLALLLDSPAMVVLAVLLAPFMGPALGPALAAVAGSLSYLLLSLGWLLAAGLIYFLSGSLTGIAARILPVTSAVQAAQHLRLDWTGLVLLTAGVVFTTTLLARSPRQKPLVSSVAVAYSLFLPLGAAGYGLTTGIGAGWLNGLLVFAVHLLWAALCGTLVLIVLGLRPRTSRGYLLSVSYLAASLAVCLAALFLSPAAPVILAQSAPEDAPVSPVAQATATETAPSATQAAAAADPSETAASGQAVTATDAVQAVQIPTTSPSLTPSPTATRTLVPTPTPTITVTPQATPVWARINAKGGDGAFIRKEPNYTSPIVIVLLNGIIVEVLPDVIIEDNATWVKVRIADGQEGWIVRSLLATATPAPSW